MASQLQSYYQRDAAPSMPPSRAVAERRRRGVRWPAVLLGVFVAGLLCTVGVVMHLQPVEEGAVDLNPGVSAFIGEDGRVLGHSLFQTSLHRGHLLKRIALAEKHEHLSTLRSDGHDDEAAAIPGSRDEERSTLLERARRFVSFSVPNMASHTLRHGGAPSGVASRRLSITPHRKYQTVVGFGGAFTEAASIQFSKLSAEARFIALSVYFSKAGLGYTLGRVPMNSCDFSPKTYSFDDVEGDVSLSHFDSNVTHDQATMIPFILSAQVASMGALRIFASPWSPPAWMKQPTFDKTIQAYLPPSMLGSADPQGLSEDPIIQQSWADYFVRFVAAYRRSGVAMWGVTVQNEPEFAAPWEACKYNSSAMRDFVGSFLGPTLKGAFPDIVLLAFDHNKDALPEWTSTTFAPDSPAAEYVDGMAYHWYAGSMDRNLDGTLGFDNVARSAATLRDAEERLRAPKMIIGTEGCNCPGVARKPADALFRAERIAHNLIADLNSYSQGWVDWNLILDADGGPNHLGNLCDAPMTLDPEDETSLTLQPMLFYMWHIEGFLPEGARRIHWEWKGVGKLHGGSWQDAGPSGAFVGMEAAVGTCDGGARQAWMLHKDGRLKVADTPLTKGQPSVCVGHINDPKLGGLLLVDCDERIEISDDFDYDAETGWVQSRGDSTTCLRPVGDVAGDRHGVHLADCDEDSEWELEDLGDEVAALRLRHSQKCLTAGWPFVSVAAFEVPKTVESEERDVGEMLAAGRKIILVMLNEGELDVPFELDVHHDDARLVSEVPAKAIQTYVLHTAS